MADPDAETPPESTRKPAKAQHIQQPEQAPAQEWTAQKAINQWCNDHKVSVKDFAAYRKAAIAGNLAADIPSDKLTKIQCDTLLGAIERNLCTPQNKSV